MPPPSSYSLIPAISAQENGFISIVLKKGLEKKNNNNNNKIGKGMVFGFMVRLNCNNLYERKNLASNRFRAIFLQATQTSPVGWTGISKKNLWQGQLAKFCYMIPHSSK